MGEVSRRESAGGGAILGALVGDAAGATLEFLQRTPSEADVERALLMVGGGTWSTAPGQVTDDGEMAICLMHAIADSDAFEAERVAVEYLRWLNSGPFDIGNTTARGLNGGSGCREGTVHLGMWQAAEAANTGSKANGALMRVAPLGVWGARLSEQELVRAACDDSRLTHSNRTCQHASATYCVAVRHLVLNFGDAAGALETATSWALRLDDEEVGSWIDLARSEAEVGFGPQHGFVKYAFTHAFRHLDRGSTFAQALRLTLAGGGDTDTNACIVGGLAGALHGIEGIPAAMRNAVLQCDTAAGRPRPGFLQTRLVLQGLISRIASAEPRSAGHGAEVPFPRSYWVLHPNLLAGEYPGAKDDETAAGKLGSLSRMGIQTIINLTEETESGTDGKPLRQYRHLLDSLSAENPVKMERHAIRDLDVPTRAQMVDILAAIDRAMRRGGVYIHCLGGIGRTGTVVGCWLVDRGLVSGRDALAHVNRLRAGSPDEGRRSPETIDQEEMVRSWTARA
jgi:ADP-ribosylglycohydrolase